MTVASNEAQTLSKTTRLPARRTRALTCRTAQSVLRKRYDGPSCIRVKEHIVSGRNRLFVAHVDTSTSWIVKQPFANTGAEVWFYSEIASHYGYAPQCLFADGPANIVVIEYLESSPTLYRTALVDPNTAFHLLRGLATALVRLHATAAVDMPEAAPPLPEFDPIDILLWQTCSPAAQEAIRRIQKRRILNDAIVQAAQGKGPHGLIHGDMKPDNILHDQSGRLFIIDWELCGLGALGWDIGAVVGAIVSLWADQVAIDAKKSVTEWVSQGGVPFDEVYNALRAFIGFYLFEAQSSGSPTPDRLTVVTHASAWIVARTWADATFLRDLTPQLLLRLLVAEGMLVDPWQLFGDLAW
jgi:serine/threonine protein kinase